MRSVGYRDLIASGYIELRPIGLARRTLGSSLRKEIFQKRF